MSDNYKTITEKAEGVYKEKGSKFISFAIPVTTANDVKIIIDNYKKEFYDARHVCYAYMLGSERNNYRSNDDGEPSGTAGRPILGQINSKELTNILVVVIRYFGGILLGTGGLTTAYKEATLDAINNATIIEKTVDLAFNITFDYVQMNDIMHVIKLFNPQIRKQSFDNECYMQLVIQKQNAALFTSKLIKVPSLKLEEIDLELTRYDK